MSISQKRRQTSVLGDIQQECTHQRLKNCEKFIKQLAQTLKNFPKFSKKFFKNKI